MAVNKKRWVKNGAWGKFPQAIKPSKKRRRKNYSKKVEYSFQAPWCRFELKTEGAP